MARSEGRPMPFLIRWFARRADAEWNARKIRDQVRKPPSAARPAFLHTQHAIDLPQPFQPLHARVRNVCGMEKIHTKETERKSYAHEVDFSRRSCGVLFCTTGSVFC